jgi:hypothetical protein
MYKSCMRVRLGQQIYRGWTNVLIHLSILVGGGDVLIPSALASAD